jgi:hypothetical protein
VYNLCPARPARTGRSPACAAANVHTATMSLKTASGLALVGMIVLSVLVAADFIHTWFGNSQRGDPHDGAAEIADLSLRSPRVPSPESPRETSTPSAQAAITASALTAGRLGHQVANDARAASSPPGRSRRAKVVLCQELTTIKNHVARKA